MFQRQLNRPLYCYPASCSICDQVGLVKSDFCHHVRYPGGTRRLSTPQDTCLSLPLEMNVNRFGFPQLYSYLRVIRIEQWDPEAQTILTT